MKTMEECWTVPQNLRAGNIEIPTYISALIPLTRCGNSRPDQIVNTSTVIDLCVSMKVYYRFAEFIIALQMNQFMQDASCQ